MSEQTIRTSIVTLAILLAIGHSAIAQTPSFWGVGVSVIPAWKAPDFIEPLFEAKPVDLSGSEFRIGVVRGRDLSGEWGVSFIRKQVKDGSTLENFRQMCLGSFGCGTRGDRYIYNGVTLTGVEVHKFIPFGTIKRRVQIGLTVGGGAGKFKGNAQHLGYDPVTVGSNGQIISVGDKPPTIESVPASELFITQDKPVPLFLLQVTGAVILAPGLKVRVGGGFDMPGMEKFSLSVSYLIGSH